MRFKVLLCLLLCLVGRTGLSRAGEATGASEAQISELITGLKDADWQKRREVLLAIARLGPEAIEALDEVAALIAEDENPEVRRLAMYACRMIDGCSQRTLPAFIGALKDKSATIRRGAADTLGGLENLPEGAVRPLLDVLGDESWHVRCKAARALGKAPRIDEQTDRELVTALVALLKDQDEAVRGAATSALGELGGRASAAAAELRRTLGSATGARRVFVAWALYRVDPDPGEIVPVFIEALRAGDERVMPSVMRMIAKMGAAAKDAVPALVEVFRDEDLEMRWKAAKALKAIGPGAVDAVPVLITALGGSDWTCVEAAEILSCIGPEARQALPYLRDRLKALPENFGCLDNNNNQSIHMAIAMALWRIDGKAEEVVPMFIAELGIGSQGDRATSARLLGEIGPGAREAVPRLVECLTDPYWKAGLESAVALGRIGPDAKAAVPELEKIAGWDRGHECWGTHEPEIRAAAREALGRIRGGQDEVKKGGAEK